MRKIAPVLLALCASGCSAFGVARCPDPAAVRRAAAGTVGRAVLRREPDARLPMEAPRLLAFRRDGVQLVGAGEEQRVVIWDARAQDELASSAPGDQGSFFLALDADAGLAAMRDGTRAAVVQLATGRRIHALDGHVGGSEYSEPVDAAAFRPGGRYLATGDDVGTLRLWRLSDGALVYARSIGSGRLSALAFSPDGGLIAAATDNDDGVRLLNADDGEVLGWLPTPVEELYHLDFSRDGSRLLASDFTEGLSVWRLDRCERVDLARPEGFASDAKLSPDGALVAAALSEGLALWNAETGALLSRLHTGRTSSLRAYGAVAFSPDGRMLAAGTPSGIELRALDR